MNTNPQPQPINTAPHDGTTILSDVGFCRWIEPGQWGSPMPKGWHECDPFGNLFECADNGYWQCMPSKWMPVPQWILDRG